MSTVNAPVTPQLQFSDGWTYFFFYFLVYNYLWLIQLDSKFKFLLTAKRKFASDMVEENCISVMGV